MHERELIHALKELGAPRVAVVGDFMIDRYVWGDAERISPEAPVPVVHAHREEDRLGGAGNVAANLAALGAVPLCFGALGRDASGDVLVEALEAAGGDASGLVRCGDRPTIQKIRVMARNQQMLRVDREDSQALSEADEAALLGALCAADWKVVVMSDYGKGVLSPALTAAVIAEAERRGAASLVDPKHRDFARYAGATLVTPNRNEAEVACGTALGSLQALAAHGEALRAGADLHGLLITLGPEGMFLLREEQEPLHLPTMARQVYDVTGAGDTVIAMLAAALGAALPLETAVRLANAAAGLAVAKVGTAAVGLDELVHALRVSSPAHKVCEDPAEEQVRGLIAALRREGRRIVFTNGCFDILHAGHVRYLREARQRGDALVVGLNSDASVRRLKGEERPFNELADRAEVLAGLEAVDLVIPFEDDTPVALIEMVEPDILVKGADWKDGEVAGADFVRARGGEVEFIDFLPGRSTTGIADRIRNR